MAAQALSTAAAALEAKFEVAKKTDFRGETTLYVDRTAIAEVCRFAKEQLGFTYLIDISSVDNFGEEPRFEVVYELYQFERGEHLRLKISVSEDDLEVPTVAGVWRTADWHEREVYDLVGVFFTGHPNLVRILLNDDWVGHPLRKDYEFPLEYHGIRCR